MQFASCTETHLERRILVMHPFSGYPAYCQTHRYDVLGRFPKDPLEV